MIVGSTANIGVLWECDRCYFVMIKWRLIEPLLKNGEDTSPCRQPESKSTLAGGFQPFGRKSFSESEEAETRTKTLKLNAA